MVNCVESLGTFQGFSPFPDLYYLHLEEFRKKIMSSSLFHHSCDFSKVFDMFRKALTIVHVFIFVHSYLHASELHTQVFDKLLRAMDHLDHKKMRSG